MNANVENKSKHLKKAPPSDRHTNPAQQQVGEPEIDTGGPASDMTGEILTIITANISAWDNCDKSGLLGTLKPD
eukprot:5165457-Heterocapsa_arctica.AAC.1